MSRGMRERYPYRESVAGGKRGETESQFDQLEASSLYCPRCRMAMPVRKRLLLILPEGERYEYLCAHCLTSVGRKTVDTKKQIDLILKP
jgi:hypothetical protein